MTLEETIEKYISDFKANKFDRNSFEFQIMLWLQELKLLRTENDQLKHDLGIFV